MAIGAILQELVDVSGAKVEVRPDPERMRPSDIPAIVGHPGKLQRATGWEAAIPLRRTLTDLLAFWRSQAASDAGAPAARA